MARRSGQQEKGWANRIVGYGEEAADQLLANDKNWRVHGKAQQEALTDVLDSVGVVQNIIVNRRTGAVVDGHLRVSLALRKDGSQTLPITYVDLSEQEEALILATLDPIAAMAAADKDQLDALLRDVDTGSAALQEMLAGLAAGVGIGGDDWGAALGDLPDGDRAPFQQMTFTLADSQAELVKAAMERAKHAGPFEDTGNENSNGNALARICEAYVG